VADRSHSSHGIAVPHLDLSHYQFSTSPKSLYRVEQLVHAKAVVSLRFGNCKNVDVIRVIRMPGLRDLDFSSDKPSRPFEAEPQELVDALLASGICNMDLTNVFEASARSVMVRILLRQGWTEEDYIHPFVNPNENMVVKRLSVATADHFRRVYL
jgi:hypothetical protein